MKDRVEETKQKIEAIIKDSQTANNNYITYIKKYYKELVEADKKIDIKDKKTEQVLQGITNYVFSQDTIKEQKQLIKLAESEDPSKIPKLQLIPTDLDTINNNIKKILTKRGFDKQDNTI